MTQQAPDRGACGRRECSRMSFHQVPDECSDAALSSVQPMPDPVQVTEMWQATCDHCGWHTPPTSPKDVVREWARLHRVTCPLKPAPVPVAPNSGRQPTVGRQRWDAAVAGAGKGGD